MHAHVVNIGNEYLKTLNMIDRRDQLIMVNFADLSYILVVVTRYMIGFTLSLRARSQLHLQNCIRSLKELIVTSNHDSCILLDAIVCWQLVCLFIVI